MTNILLSLNFELSATNIIGALLLVAAAVFTLCASKIYTFFVKGEEPTVEKTNMIKIIALILAIIGALLIINY